MSMRALIRSLLSAGKGLVGGLSEEAAGHDPLALFGRWFREAEQSGIYLPEAMTLATISADGGASARMMLLKGFDERGFRFFTNYESRKSQELLARQRAALVFHWARLHRQVRVEGEVFRLSDDESAEYFRSRPRGSQLGAWASKQSSVLASRRQLEERYRQLESRFRGSEVPLPPFWGGFRLLPHRIEFWQGRANRLHDRLQFTRKGDGWKVVRLSP
ncbi:MAG: pyridoxamine 5'-phosphate oxidase [Gemmatimonadota bacterium]|nr:MAG: pyridoxamine 5'-phosphate oxidase [Gemmatimonadota bacterium]